MSNETEQTTEETTPPTYKVLHVKTTDELTGLTMRGWRLRATVRKRVDTEYNTFNGFSTSVPIYEDALIMEEPNDRRVEYLQDEVEGLRARVAHDESEMRKAKHSHKNEVEVLEGHLRSAAAEVDESKRLLEAATKISDDVVKRMRHLEGDMAKVRAAIGDLKWNEILAKE